MSHDMAKPTKREREHKTKDQISLIRVFHVCLVGDNGLKLSSCRQQSDQTELMHRLIWRPHFWFSYVTAQIDWFFWLPSTYVLIDNCSYYALIMRKPVFRACNQAWWLKTVFMFTVTKNQISTAHKASRLNSISSNCVGELTLWLVVRALVFYQGCLG